METSAKVNPSAFAKPEAWYNPSRWLSPPRATPPEKVLRRPHPGRGARSYDPCRGRNLGGTDPGGVARAARAQPPATWLAIPCGMARRRCSTWKKARGASWPSHFPDPKMTEYSRSCQTWRVPRQSRGFTILINGMGTKERERFARRTQRSRCREKCLPFV